MSPDCFSIASESTYVGGVLPKDFCAVGTWRWSSTAAPRGFGSVLVAHASTVGTSWVVAPPTVSLQVDESDEMRKQWRVARFYAAHPEELIIALGTHVPGSYQQVTVDELRSVVPTTQQKWIDLICSRQRALADSFGRQDPRMAPLEEHARAASTRFSELAGIAESRRRASDEFEHVRLEVPDTVDECFGRMPVGGTASARPASSDVTGDAPPSNHHGPRTNVGIAAEQAAYDPGARDTLAGYAPSGDATVSPGDGDGDLGQRVRGSDSADVWREHPGRTDRTESALGKSRSIHGFGGAGVCGLGGAGIASSNNASYLLNRRAKPPALVPMFVDTAGEDDKCRVGTDLYAIDVSEGAGTRLQLHTSHARALLSGIARGNKFRRSST